MSETVQIILAVCIPLVLVGIYSWGYRNGAHMACEKGLKAMDDLAKMLRPDLYR